RSLACDAGALSSCEEVGLMYMRGDGVPKDAAKGLTFLQRACNGGVAATCTTIGWFYAGQMRPADATTDFDPKKAIHYYERACNSGDAFGCTYLGELYLELKHQADANGLSGAVSQYVAAVAVAAFQRACDARAGNACDDMGMVLQKGEDVAADPVRAVKSF